MDGGNNNMEKGGGSHLAYDFVPLGFQSSHKALWHGSTVVLWLTHVGFVLAWAVERL